MSHTIIVCSSCLLFLTRIAISTVLGGEPGASQSWVNIAPGGGGWFQCMEYSPHVDLLLVGGDAGSMYASRDGGKTFRIRNRGLVSKYANSIVFHPTDKDTVYVGTEAGVHKSTDGGRTWVSMHNGFKDFGKAKTPSAPIHALTIDPAEPEVLYAGLGYLRNFGSKHKGDAPLGAIYKTTDGARSWRRILVSTNLVKESIMALEIDPADRNRVYALAQSGLFVSIDRGESWGEMPALPYSGRRYTCLAIKRDEPQTLFVSYAGRGVKDADGKRVRETGVLRSRDRGRTWAPVLQRCPKRPGAGVKSFKPHPREPDTFFAAIHKGYPGVYRTTDGGDTWTAINDPEEKDPSSVWSGWSPTATDFAISPRDPDVMAYCNDHEIYQTTDGARTWQLISAVRLKDATAEHPALWQASGRPDILVASAVAVDPRDARVLYLGYYDSLLWKSIDGGESLFRIHQSFKRGSYGRVSRLVLDPDNPDIVYAAAGWNGDRQTIWKSTNGGRHFQKTGHAGTGLCEDGSIKALVLDPRSPPDARVLYVTLTLTQRAVRRGAERRAEGIYRSSDGGNSWQSLSNGFPRKNRSFCSMALDPQNPDTLYVCGRPRGNRSGYVAKSADGGLSWAIVLDGIYGRAVAVDPHDPRIVYVGSRDFTGTDTDKVFWRSTDAGATWTSVPNAVFNVGPTSHPYKRYDVGVIAVDPQRAGRLYVTFQAWGNFDYGNDGWIFVSDDYGQTWNPLSYDGYGGCFNVENMFIDPVDPDRLYVLTGGTGVWRYGPAPAAKPENVVSYYSVVTR